MRRDSSRITASDARYSWAVRSAESATSASPRMMLRGVRSSCEASATRRVLFRSDWSRRASSSLKLATRVSISSAAWPIWMRVLRLLPVIRRACAALLFKGRSARPASRYPPIPASASTSGNPIRITCIAACEVSATGRSEASTTIRYVRPPAVTTLFRSVCGSPESGTDLAASSRPPSKTRISSPCSFIAFTVSFADACTSPLVSANSSRKMPAAVSASVANAVSMRACMDLEMPPYRKTLKRANSSENSPRYRTVSRSRKLLGIGRLRMRGENIALSAARVDQAVAGARVQLGPQPLDVDVDQVGERIEVLLPYVLRDRFAPHDTALVQHQKLQQGIFLGRKIDRPAAACDGMAPGGEPQIGDVEQLRPRYPRAACQRAQACEQFFEVERLYQVIVGAAIEPCNPVFDRSAGGEHQDRRAKSGAPQFAAHRMPIASRQEHVEDHHVVLIDGCQVQRTLSLDCDVHRVRLLTQALGDEGSQPGFIFHQENPHNPYCSYRPIRDSRNVVL